MFPPTPEEHLNFLEDLQRLNYYIKNMQNKRTIDKVRDIVEKIQSNYSYLLAKPTRDALELLEEGRYNDERIDNLFGIQQNILDEYLVAMSKYRDDYSILNDGWH
jgi:aminoglycoside phosphotransferase family enzyme